MPFGSPARPREPLNVIAMAIALALAAFAGGALGLLWHSVGGGDEAEPEVPARLLEE